LGDYDMRAVLCVLAAVVAFTAASVAQSSGQLSPAAERAFTALLIASAADDVGAATDAIMKSGVAFDAAYARLK
jgi:hypothetical protein